MCYGVCIIINSRRVIIIKRRIIRLISIIPKTSCCFSVIFTVFNPNCIIYIGLVIFISSALSINTLLIFDMKLVNGALFLNAKNLFHVWINPLLSVFVRVIPSFTAMYTSLKSHKSDRSIDVLNLICLLGLYLSLALPDWSWASTHFLGTVHKYVGEGGGGWGAEGFCGVMKYFMHILMGHEIFFKIFDGPRNIFLCSIWFYFHNFIF